MHASKHHPGGALLYRWCVAVLLSVAFWQKSTNPEPTLQVLALSLPQIALLKVAFVGLLALELAVIVAALVSFRAIGFAVLLFALFAAYLTWRLSTGLTQLGCGCGSVIKAESGPRDLWFGLVQNLLLAAWGGVELASHRAVSHHLLWKGEPS